MLFGGCDDSHPHGGRFSVRAPLVVFLPRARRRRARTVVVVCMCDMNKGTHVCTGWGGVRGNTCDHSFMPRSPESLPGT